MGTNECRRNGAFSTGQWRLFICLLFTFLFVFAKSTGIGNNKNPFDGAIRATPQGKTINVTYFDIFCTINQTLIPNNTGDITSEKLDLQSASENEKLNFKKEIVNETTALFHLFDLKRGANHIYCHLPHSILISGFHVYVGDLPAKVDAVNCTLPGWANFTCTWTIPHNDIETVYTATVQYKGRNGRGPRKCHIFPVNETTTGCTLNHDDYFAAHRTCFLKINGTNQLGTTISPFDIDQFQNVIPTPPVNLRGGPNKTISSFSITFNITKDYGIFRPGLLVEIEYCSNLNQTWTVVNTSNILIKQPPDFSFTYDLKDLPYPGAQYDVRVYLRPPNGTYRSERANRIFSTLPSRPASSPLTTPGTFEYHHRSEVTVYWRELDKFLKNSPTVSYNVSWVDSLGERCRSDCVITQDTFAKFENLKDREYTFRIYAFNEAGSSANFSEVLVPRYQTVQPVSSPVVMDLNNGSYTVSWNDQDDPTVAYYTVFYCEENRKERIPGPCQGPLMWETVVGNDKTIVVENDTAPHIFGVSVQNKADQSSGIFWATCSVRHRTGDHTVRSFSTSDKHSRSVLLEWKLGCLARNQLEGFFITYCKALHNGSADSTCTEKLQNVTILGSSRTSYNLTNLLPYSTYKVDIAIILAGDNRLGLKKSIDVSTSEDVPDPPTELTAVNVDHASAVLNWKLPENANGVLQNYVLKTSSIYGTKETNILTRNVNVTQYNVTDLISSTNYHFTLIVCNTRSQNSCSSPTETSVVTSIYYPEKMAALAVTVLNQTAAKLQWAAPKGLRNSQCYYEVRLEKYKTKPRFHKVDCSENKTAVHIEELCEDGVGQIDYSIRAVNIDSSVLYAGNFSAGQLVPCVVVSNSYIIITFVVASFVGLLIILASCVIYLVRRSYIKCEPFKSKVDIAMPGGLSAAEDANWPPERGVEDHLPVPSMAAKKPQVTEKKIAEEENLIDSAVKQDAFETWVDAVTAADIEEDKKNNFQFTNGYGSDLSKADSGYVAGSDSGTGSVYSIGPDSGSSCSTAASKKHSSYVTSLPPLVQGELLSTGSNHALQEFNTSLTPRLPAFLTNGTPKGPIHFSESSFISNGFSEKNQPNGLILPVPEEPTMPAGFSGEYLLDEEEIEELTLYTDKSPPTQSNGYVLPSQIGAV